MPCPTPKPSELGFCFFAWHWRTRLIHVDLLVFASCPFPLWKGESNASGWTREEMLKYDPALDQGGDGVIPIPTLKLEVNSTLSQAHSSG